MLFFYTLYHVQRPKISPAKPCTASMFQRFYLSRCALCLGLSKPLNALFTQKFPYLLRLRKHLYSVAEQHIVKGQPKIAKQNQLFPAKAGYPIFSIKKQGFLHTPRWQEALITATLQLCFYEATRKSFYHLRIPLASNTSTKFNVIFSFCCRKQGIPIRPS